MDSNSNKDQAESSISIEKTPDLLKKTSSANSRQTTIMLDSGELGKIQELLFGDQLLAVSNQLDALRLYIDQQLTLIREDCATQLASLKKLTDMQLVDVAKKQRSNDEDVTSKLARCERALDELDIQLSAQISDLGTRLTNDLTANDKTMQQRVDKAIHQLTEQKMDRAVLSSLLEDVAMKLANISITPTESNVKIQGQDSKKMYRKEKVHKYGSSKRTC